MNREYTIKTHQIKLKVIIVMSVIAWFMRNKPYLSLLPSSRIITYFPRSFHGHVKVVVKDALFNVFGTSRILSSYWKWKENKSENVCVSYFIIFNLSSIENNNYWINYFFCQIAWNLSQHITLKKNTKKPLGIDIQTETNFGAIFDGKRRNL